MNRLRALRSIGGVVLLAASILALIVILNLVIGGVPRPEVGAPGDETLAATDTPPEAYPPPGETESTPAPTRWLRPAETNGYTEPFVTPWATLTPRPSPTRVPGATATPFPIRGPATDASGTIIYASRNPGGIMGVSVGKQGEKVTDAALLPLSLDFVPTLGPSSPDGRYYLLLQPVEPAGIPYVFDSQTQQMWPLFKGHPMQQHITGWPYGWHPDSRQVLFWFFNNDESLLVNIETGAYTVLALTEGGPVQGAAISPDGQKVVYVDKSGGDEKLWIVSSAGGDTQLLFDPQGLSYVFGWSPMGTYILYVDGSGFDKSEEATVTATPAGPLWIIDPTGQNRKPLSGSILLGWGFEPIWSPDGQWIAYTGLDEGQSFGCANNEGQEEADYQNCYFEGSGIYIENIVTGEIRRLASGIEPTWSPDGSIVAFISNQGGSSDIWSIRIDGTGLQQLTSDTQTKWQVFWAQSRR